MTETILTQNKLKKIEDLTSREIGMIYSLSRTRWSYAEIGRRYGISETDARTVVDNYEELRELSERKPPEEIPNRNPKTELATTKPRKRRSDAIYATAKDRQAAFRAKLREKRHAAVEQRSASGVADPTSKAEEELSVTLCEGTTLEVTREASEPRRSIPDSSSNEGYGNVGSTPVPVTSEDFNESGELQVIEGKT